MMETGTGTGGNTLIRSRTVKNAAWIIGCRIVQAVLALIVTMISARYLGPSGYGLINYAASIVAFFIPVMQLGLNSTLVQEIIQEPELEGETVGTTLILCLISSVICVVSVGTFTAAANHGDTQTIWICVLYSILLVFRALEMIHYWFQAKLLAKYTSVAVLAAYGVVAVYRILLLVMGGSIYLFAVSQAMDVALISFAELLIYRKLSGQKLHFSWKRAKKMLDKSKHYIIPGLMITIFAQTDRVMLKLMMNDEAVGFYSAAVSCASLTAFIFVAIIDSARPMILEGKKQSNALFEERLKLLYAIIIILALLQSGLITLLSKSIVTILYGSEYGRTVQALQIVVWYTTFSYLGAVRDIWILAENKQKYLLAINLSGAAANVLLNAVLIPHCGINGAAAASLVTQIVTNVMTGWIIPAIRPSNWLMMQSLHPKFLLSYGTSYAKRHIGKK